MRKGFVVLLLIVAVAVLGGPGYTASSAREQLDAQVAKANSLPGYRAELINYESGWWSSKASVRVGVDLEMMTMGSGGLSDEDRAKLAEMPDSVVFDMTIGHGPVIFTDGIRVGMVSMDGSLNLDEHAKAAELRKSAGVDSFFQYQSLTSLLGETAFQAQSPQFEASFEVEKAITLSFGGMEMEGTYNYAAGTSKAVGQMAKMTLVGERGSVVIEPVTFNADMEILSELIQLGSGEFTLQSIRFFKTADTSADPDVILENLGLVYSADRDSDETLKMTVDYRIGRLHFDDNDIKDAHLKLDFERLSIEAIEQYYDGILEMMAQTRQGDESLPAQQMEAMQATAGAFLKHSPVFAISDLSFKYDGQSLKSNARFEIDGTDLADVSVLNNPMMMLGRLKVDAAADLTEGLALELTTQMLFKQLSVSPMTEGMSIAEIKNMAATQAPTVLAMQTQQGMLQKTEDGYKATFAMSNGSMTLNGQPFPMF